MDTYILKYYHGNQKKPQEHKETFIVTYQITEKTTTIQRNLHCNLSNNGKQQHKETFIATYQITENNNTKKPSLQLIK